MTLMLRFIICKADQLKTDQINILMRLFFNESTIFNNRFYTKREGKTLTDKKHTPGKSLILDTAKILPAYKMLFGKTFMNQTVLQITC